MNNCYLCGNKTNSLYKFTLKNEKNYSIYECHNCGLLRTSPIPGKEDLKAIYGSRV